MTEEAYLEYHKYHEQPKNPECPECTIKHLRAAMFHQRQHDVLCINPRVYLEFARILFHEICAGYDHCELFMQALSAGDSVYGWPKLLRNFRKNHVNPSPAEITESPDLQAAFYDSPIHNQSAAIAHIAEAIREAPRIDEIVSTIHTNPERVLKVLLDTYFPVET